MTDYTKGHNRDGIRQATVNLLKNKTAAAERVHNNRLLFLNTGVFPVIKVSTPYERVKAVLSDNPLSLHRELTIRIEIKTRSSHTSENDLDQISRVVEGLLSEDEHLENGCDLTFISAETSYTTIGRHNFDSLLLDFSCEYDTEAPAPENLDPFITAHADFDIDDDADIEASNTETLTQI